MKTISLDRIVSIETKKHDLAEAMAAPNLAPEDFVRLSKEYAQIEPVASAAREVRRLRAELEVLTGLAADSTAEQELRELAAHEAEEIREKLPLAERALALKLLPRDAADERAAMLEVRAGTGGDEAALFAGDLLRMYQRFAEEQGWRFELISANASDVGGYKEAIASISGTGVTAAPLPAPPAPVEVVEYYHAPLNHYFLTADPVEAAALDAGLLGPDWKRTGQSFRGYAGGTSGGGAVDACRFFGTPGLGPSSHFYTGNAAECAAVRTNPRWLDEGVAFRAIVPLNGASTGSFSAA